jgi:hypothetical protein
MDLELTEINPAQYNLPATHVVQALPERYILADILTKTLEKLWPKNWHLEVSHS